MVKVIGCKPIGFPGVGSNPTHLNKVSLMFFAKVKHLPISLTESMEKKDFKTIFLNNMLRWHNKLFSVFSGALTVQNQKNFLGIISQLSCKVTFAFFVENRIYFLKKFKSRFLPQPFVLVILDHDLNKIASACLQKSNLIFKAVNAETEFNKNTYPLLVHLASALNKNVYFSFIKYFFYKTYEVRKINNISNLKKSLMLLSSVFKK